MKWLKVYGLPKLPLFLRGLRCALGCRTDWYKWKAASAGPALFSTRCRAADDPRYDAKGRATP